MTAEIPAESEPEGGATAGLRVHGWHWPVHGTDGLTPERVAEALGRVTPAHVARARAELAAAADDFAPEAPLARPVRDRLTARTPPDRNGNPMTQPATPADELRAAATRLRDLATAARSEDWGDRPWQAEECADKEEGSCACIVSQGEYRDFDQPQVPPVQYVADAELTVYAAYIAAMHPGVGAALAVLLENFATGDHKPHASGTNDCLTRCQRAHPGQLICNHDDRAWPCPDVQAALAVARLINTSA